jgi:hypothetical protein
VARFPAYFLLSFAAIKVGFSLFQIFFLISIKTGLKKGAFLPNFQSLLNYLFAAMENPALL